MFSVGGARCLPDTNIRSCLLSFTQVTALEVAIIMEMRIYFSVKSAKSHKIDWNFHWKERHGAGADSVTEHPFVKSECSVKLKKSCTNNPEARTGNAFQVCLQLSLNVGTCFFLPHSFRRDFCFLETYYKALPLGTVCLWKTMEGEEETYWRLVTFYYNPHCTILSGEMDLWKFKLKTRDST